MFPWMRCLAWLRGWALGRVWPGSVALLAACDPSAPLPAGPALPVVPTLNSPPVCEDTLEAVQRMGPRCPAAFRPDANVADQACLDGNVSLSVASSELFTSLWYGYGEGQTQCVYDRSNSALIGIWKSEDVPSFCNATSFFISAGEVDTPPTPLTKIDCSSFRPPVATLPSPAPVACPDGPAPFVFEPYPTNGFRNFALSASDVYWSDGYYGVFRRSKGGTDFAPVVLDQPGGLVSILDSTLYWSAGQGIFHQPLAGGAESGPFALDATGPWSVSGSAIYYIAAVPSTLNSQLKSAPLDGATPTVLSEGSWWSAVLTTDATGVYWFMVPRDVHLDPRLQKYDFATRAVTDFAPPREDVRFLQVAGQRVLWLDDGGIWSSAADGSERISLAQPPRVQALGSDGTNVYWAQGAVDDHASDAALFSDVLSIPLAGGEPHTVVCHAYAVRNLRADDGAVYYDDTVSDMLVRVPRVNAP